MYLTRAFLDPTSPAVRANMRNAESLHKTIMLAFPDDSGPSARQAHGVLHRLDHEQEGRVVLLMQSRTKPNMERWPAGYLLDLGRDLDLAFSNVGDNPAVRALDQERATLTTGQRFAFRLRANTTRKIDTKTGPDGKRRHGRRVPVRGDTERLNWLSRHAETGGFAIDEGALRISEIAAAQAHGSQSITLAGALFEGILEVRDPARFCAAIETGIGPAKAYGFGLLSIRRVS